MKQTPIHIHQCALIISLRCTLKCKLCLVFAPYYENPKDYELVEVNKSIDTFFSLIDSCGTFNIQGGEPLMHKHLPEIIDRVIVYKEKIGKIFITTNGTLLPSVQLLELLRKNCDCLQINISNYGASLSKRVPELVEMLQNAEVPYRIINYSDGDIHFGGWLDFTDHTYKHQTEEALINNAKDCGYRKGGNLAIRLGELYFCYRVARRVELGIVPKDEHSCIDMYSAKSNNEKRQNIRDILNAPYTPACAYCIGKRSDAKHYPPAIQVTKKEINIGVEKL